MQYGLLGEHLGHSYSPQIHSQLGSYEYRLLPVAPAAFDAFIAERNFQGVNITIPYKQRVMALCDKVDPLAQRIGAVNTVVNHNGRLVGYNTDYSGFARLFEANDIAVEGKTVLLLGNGGTTRTAKAVLQDKNAARILVASRRPAEGSISYGDAAAQKQVQIIVNCSPAGMYPNNGVQLLQLGDFPVLEAAVDVVYNPFKTALLLQAQRLGYKAVGGLGMLVVQAALAAQLFTGKPLAEQPVDRIQAMLRESYGNISLIGMPGSGKTSLGRSLAKQLGRNFVDLDAVVADKAGKSIPEIFEQDGEEAFRDLESIAAQEAGKEHGQVIATGGGAVKRQQNIDALRQNGIILWLDCPVKRLSLGGYRPLARSMEDLIRLEGERRTLYQDAADGRVEHQPYFPRHLQLLLESSKELLRAMR